MPRLTPDEVKIEVEDGVLTVSGEHQEDRSDSVGGRYVRRERRFGAVAQLDDDAFCVKNFFHDCRVGAVRHRERLDRGRTTGGG